jgi:SAM-dependent methyltransferase
MTDREPKFLKDVAAKLAEHGESPRGVDWNGAESQRLRFEQMSKIIDQPADFSLNDLGCGYGGLYDYLCLHYSAFAYNGVDVSGDMIRAAQSRYSNVRNARFAMAAEPWKIAHYGVASGIFNVRLAHNDIQWQEHVSNTLDILNHTSSKGFSFNCLTSYSDSDKKQNYLYYADPCGLFDLCKCRYSRHVALLHDYGLHEFTILVRKH